MLPKKQKQKGGGGKTCIMNVHTTQTQLRERERESESCLPQTCVLSSSRLCAGQFSLSVTQKDIERSIDATPENGKT